MIILKTFVTIIDLLMVTILVLFSKCSNKKDFGSILFTCVVCISNAMLIWL